MNKKLNEGLYASPNGKEVVTVQGPGRMKGQDFYVVHRWLPKLERVGVFSAFEVGARWPLRVSGCVVE